RENDDCESADGNGATGGLPARIPGTWGRSARRRSERGVVLENRVLEPLEPFSRLQTELLGKQAPPLLIDVESLRLAPRAVEREHQLGAKALTERVLADERMKLGDELRVPAQREIRVHPLLDCAQAELFEPGTLELDEAGRVEIGKRLTAPEVERLA